MKAYAKVNLILKVFSKKQNSDKHEIHSIFCLYKKLYDEVDIKSSTQTKIDCKGLDTKQILKAISFLSKKINKIIKLHIVIKKHIPFMSGLGGSSTVVATIMRWIIKKYKINLSSIDYKIIAREIGSDIPFFLSGYNVAEIKGIGDKITKFNKPLPKYKVVMTKTPVSTQQAYKEFDKHNHEQFSFHSLYKQLMNGNVSNLNYLQSSVCLMNSKIKKIIQEQPNRYLCGSGGSIIEIIK